MTSNRVALLGALALLALAGAGCKDRKPQEAKTESAEAGVGAEKRESPDRVRLGEEAFENSKLDFVKVEEKDLAPVLEVTAELVPDPDRRADVGSRTAARVLGFKVKLGDRVAPGTPLVVLESTEVGKARAQLRAAEARAEVARQAADREQALLDARATSRREALDADAAAKTAASELAAVRTTLAALGAAEEDGGDPSRLVLRSPIAGTVVARSAHVGQSVEPSATLVEVVDLERLWLEAQVYEREMRFVAPGQLVQLETRAFPGEVFRGKVDRIGDVLDARTRAVKVRVSLPNPGHRLKPGMFATARIVGTHANAPRRMVVIPWAAVQEIDGHPAVFVREGEREFQLHRVHTGERAGDLVKVLNGVKVGDVVVAEGSFLLKGELLRATLGGDE